MVVFLLYGFAIPRAVADTGTLTGLTADAEARSNGIVASGTGTYCGVGNYWQVADSAVVYMFQIPSEYLRDHSQEFTAASFSAYLASKGPMQHNADLYGIGYSSTSSAVMASDFYQGALDANSTLIQDNFLIPTTPTYTLVSVTNGALVDYLNAQLRAARQDGASTAYVFFRLNSDGSEGGNRYIIAMADVATDSNRPKLSYTTVPLSDWSSVPLGGGGFVTGLVSDSTGSDIYCRCDVGGAFKWNAAGGNWYSITDNALVSSTNPLASDLMGISSIAVDPSNSSNIYVAAGSYTTSTLHGIFASTDKGASWTKINSTFLAAGNGTFRTYGERLAVDPNNSSILWFGSMDVGLQKAVFSSGTWGWTQVPSTSVPFGQVPSGEKAGVTFVACDKNAGNTIVYAGVYDSVGSGTTGGIYMSSDGMNWSKVGGISMRKPARGQVAPNGTLYVTQSGTVGKLLRGGTLSAITPAAGVNYIGIAVDPNDATGNTVYVAQSSSAQYSKIYRTATGGTSWTTQSTNFNNGNYTRTEPDGTPTCTGYWFGSISSLLVSATNSNELWAGDFFGVARTQNAQNLGTGSSTFWYMLQKNQEETCVEYLLNAPTGAKLMVGNGDIGGALYWDTTVRPAGAGGKGFGNPSGGSNPGLDFAESDNNVWARTWVNPSQNGGSGAASSDGGVTWKQFGQAGATRTVTCSGTAGWENWDISTYLAKQKAKGVNAVTLVVACGNSISPLWSTSLLTFESKESGTANAPQLLINGTTSLIATADSYVADAASGTNYGTGVTIATSYMCNQAGSNRWAYIKFDLSGVAAITSGTLQLHRPSVGSTISRPVGIFVCPNTSWVETTITWANKPTPLSSSGDLFGDPRYYDGATLLHGGRVAVSSTNPNIMVWLPQYPVDNTTTTGPRYSNDRGVTWTASTGAPNSQNKSRDNPSNLLNQLASDRVNGKFYIANFSGAGSGNHAVYTSTNNGVSFVLTGTCATSSYNIYRAQLKAAPAANDVWISDDGVSGTTAGGVWRSTNGAATWARVGGTAIRAVSEVAFGKAQTGGGYTVFINGYKNGIKGIYRSDDYGVTWATLDVMPTGASIQALAGDRQNYGKVFFGTGGRGVYQGQ